MTDQAFMVNSKIHLPVLQQFFASVSSGAALHKIILDEDKRPSDFLFLGANKAFEDLARLNRSDIINKTASEVWPGIGKTPFHLIETCGEVALTGEGKTFETYLPFLNKWGYVTALCPEKEFFVTIYHDLSDRKKMILPICSYCKRIRNSDGKWVEIDLHTVDTLGMQLSHGICPECGGRLYPDVFRGKDDKLLSH